MKNEQGDIQPSNTCIRVIISQHTYLRTNSPFQTVNLDPIKANGGRLAVSSFPSEDGQYHVRTLNKRHAFMNE